MAKKISLREFQTNLVARLTSAAKGETTTAQLGVMSGQEHWLLPLTEAGEIVPLSSELTPVPLTRHWFAGIANIRGNLYSVIDLAAFHGLEPTPYNSDSRLLLVGDKFGTNSALLLSRTLGLRTPDDYSEEGRDDDDPPWVAGRLRDAQGTLWKRLNARALLAHPDFIQIGA